MAYLTLSVAPKQLTVSAMAGNYQRPETQGQNLGTLKAKNIRIRKRNAGK